MAQLPPVEAGNSSLAIETKHKEPGSVASKSSQQKRFRLLSVDSLALESFEIGSPPPYLAVSHVWSDDIFAGGLRFSSSLGSRAVKKALSGKFPAVKHCWIDTFCILQNDEKDKFDQIPLMGDIYRNAEAVLIIHACEFGLTQEAVDEATSGLEVPIDLFRYATPYYDQRYDFWRSGDGYERLAAAMKVLARFARSAWCTRVWTLQEFVLARQVIWIGTDLIPLVSPDMLFSVLPGLCDDLSLEELASQSSDPEIVSLHRNFIGMVDIKLGNDEPTRIMAVAGSREASVPVDEIYGPMVASRVVIPPLPNETVDEAWTRWCEAAVSSGHIRWLILPPMAQSVFPDDSTHQHQTKSNCLYPPVHRRSIAFCASPMLRGPRPYDQLSISDGTVTVPARFAGRCRLLRTLGPLHEVGGKMNPGYSLIMFSEGDPALAAQIAESFSARGFPRDQLDAIAKVLENNYEFAVEYFNSGNPQTDARPVMESELERQAYFNFSNFVGRLIMPTFYGSIAHLALLEDEELQISYPVAVALGDRIPTGRLYAFDVNALDADGRTTLVILEGPADDGLRKQQDDSTIAAEHGVIHKIGVTTPLGDVVSSATIQRISIGGSRCSVCHPASSPSTHT